MNYRKVLNVFVLLLIFTPFFKVCDSNGFLTQEGTIADSSQVYFEEGLNKEITSVETPKEIKLTQDSALHKQSVLSFLIYPSQDNPFVISGFGLIVQLFMDVQFPLLSVLILMSFLINSSILFESIKFRFALSLLNVLLIISATLVSVNLFEGLQSLEWGFYCYSSISLILVIVLFFEEKKKGAFILFQKR